MNNETKMSAEDFFGELEPDNRDKVPARKGRTRGKKSMKGLFAEVKVKMVMRIYGVTKARAQEIIAGRADEKRELKSANDEASTAGKGNQDSIFMSAEEFFGA